jgi:hypothetical protein
MSSACQHDELLRRSPISKAQGRPTRFIAPLLSWLLLGALGSPAQPRPAPERGFVSSEPAQTWEQALISGNGKFGALVYGQPLEETIVLNHARLFMPLHEPLPPVDTASHLTEIRRLLATGEYQRAADRVVELSRQQGYGGKRWTDPFVPAFDLRVTMMTNGAVENYSRSVDFATGVAAVNWSDARGEFLRRLFVSRPDDVVALDLRGSRKGGVDCDFQLTPREPKGQGGWGAERMFQLGVKESLASAEDGWLTYRSGFRKSWPGSLQGYEGVARVLTRGGTRRTAGDKIQVRGADAVLVLTRIELLEDFAQSKIPALKSALAKVQPDFTTLLARHAKVHGALFSRARLDLGGGADRQLTSEALLAKSGIGKTPPALLEKQFDAARYAVISSSGELFPNLQGIWGGTFGPPWSGDFTLNGNVQTALAADLSGNLAECLLPFFAYLEAHLAEFRTNAARLYGCRGIHVPSRASSHGLNNHFDDTWPMTFWTAGAGWAAHFYYDYYLYTGDRHFLRTRALPFMKEAALFYEDFLISGPDGKLLFSPSYSPENNPGNMPDPKTQACFNATMDIAVARELLTQLIAACTTLKVEPDGVRRWQALLARLPDYMINSEGAIQEWTTPRLTDNYKHRHTSHLYALYYGMPPEIGGDPKLRAAFDKAVELRMDFRREDQSGTMAFGLVQLGDTTASLRDVEKTGVILDWLANWYWTSSLTTTHNKQSLFNTDICGGMPNLIIRMLVDSQPGWIELLPVLPKSWPSGKLEGVRCRGQIEVRQLAWDARTISVTLKSAIAQDVDLRLPGGATRKVALPRNREIQRQFPR